MKAEVVDILKRELGPVDLFVYSLAAPRRTRPADGVTYRSTLKPIGKPYTNKTLDFNTGVVRGGLMAAALMNDLPAEVIRQRLSLLPGQVLHALVDYDRFVEEHRGERAGVSPFFFHGLLDMLVAELTAPVSPATVAAMKRPS